MTDYDELFYRKQLRQDRQDSYKALADIVATYDPKFVVDFGCGAGWMMYYLWDMGIDVLGFEPSKKAAACATNLDIGQYIEDDPIDVKMNYTGILTCDVATSFEVLEHISPDHAQVAVANICRYTDNVVFSAARPGQGGRGHVNEQPKEYWIDKFRQEGFVWDVQKTKLFVAMLIDRRVKSWYHKNLLVLRRLGK